MTPTRLFSLRLVLAFAAIYIIWGSTYIAIRWAIETLPPLVMAGLRFVSAGALLYAWARLRGAPRPTAAQWREGAVLGLLLLGFGNGMVSWSAQRLPSGLIAVIVGMVPAWVVLIEALGPRRVRPSVITVAGVAIGVLGIAWLVGPGLLGARNGVDPLGAIALLFGTFMWSIGTVRSRGARQPASPLLATAVQMLAGGVLQLLAATARGEVAAFDPAQVSMRSAFAVVYLMIFGSLVGFTAYSLLMRVAPPVLGTDSLQVAKEKLGQFESARFRGDGCPLPTRTPVGRSSALTSSTCAWSGHVPRPTSKT